MKSNKINNYPVCVKCKLNGKCGLSVEAIETEGRKETRVKDSMKCNPNLEHCEVVSCIMPWFILKSIIEGHGGQKNIGRYSFNTPRPHTVAK